MKKLLLFSAFIAFAFAANAQSTSYHAFKVDVDFGYAIPGSSSNSGGSSSVKAGATFTVEPHYRLSDQFAVGLRIEAAALGYASPDGSGGYNSAKVTALGSYCATAEYYLMDGGFRPFVGAGFGLFTQASVSANNNGNNGTVTSPASTGAGFFPRIGFETGHLRLSAAYNIVGNNNSYAAFTIGFFLGGGKK